jgi:hypothetical protein
MFGTGDGVMKGEVRPIPNMPRRRGAYEPDVNGTDDERLRFAIANKRLVQFVLHGLVRIAEPHDYGIRYGAPQLLVYQVGGQSASGRLPAWRWVLLRHVSYFEVLDHMFTGNRSAEPQRHAIWERLFARVE